MSMSRYVTWRCSRRRWSRYHIQAGRRLHTLCGQVILRDHAFLTRPPEPTRLCKLCTAFAQRRD
jgi:hypothetical protein